MIGDVAGLDLLDIGCGDGLLAAELSSAGAHVTGIDPDAAMLRAAAERTAGQDIRFVQGRIEALPFADACFDLVMAVTVLCFVKDDADIPRRDPHAVVRPHMAVQHEGDAAGVERRVGEVAGPRARHHDVDVGLRACCKARQPEPAIARRLKIALAASFHGGG